MLDWTALVIAILSVPVLGDAISRFLLPYLVKINFNTYGHSDGILLDFDPQRTLGGYRKSNRVLNSSMSIVITFENTSTSGNLKIAPFAFLRLKALSRLPDSVMAYVSPKEGLGGGGTPRYFYGSLSSRSRQISCATFINSDFGLFLDAGQSPTLPDTHRREFEYFTLPADEIETVIIEICPENGYYYNFDVGIPIKIKGKERIIWSRHNYSIAIPTQATYFRSSKILHDIHSGHPDLGDTPQEAEDAPLTPWIDQTQARSHWKEVDFPSRDWLPLLSGLCNKYGSSEFELRPEAQEIEDARSVISRM